MAETAEIDPADLADITCPALDCHEPTIAGTLRFDDRGPFQLISIRRYTCAAGHRWQEETDGS